MPIMVWHRCTDDGPPAANVTCMAWIKADFHGDESWVPYEVHYTLSGWLEAGGTDLLS